MYFSKISITCTLRYEFLNDLNSHTQLFCQKICHKKQVKKNHSYLKHALERHKTYHKQSTKTIRWFSHLRWSVVLFKCETFRYHPRFNHVHIVRRIDPLWVNDGLMDIEKVICNFAFCMTEVEKVRDPGLDEIFCNRSCLKLARVDQ